MSVWSVSKSEWDRLESDLFAARHEVVELKGRLAHHWEEIEGLRRALNVTKDTMSNALWIVISERDRLRKALESAPEPTMIDPETQQPQLRTDMYRNPVPEDRRYAEWYGDEREPALKGDE